MAPSDRTAVDIRRDIEAERGALAKAVEDLRSGISEATNISAKLESKLPAAAAAALGAGFLLAGGIGATARLIFRRRREGTEWARLGRFVVSERD